MGDHLITTLGWQQVAAMAGVALLAAAMTAQPIAPTLATAATAAKSLLAGPLTGGRLGRITRAAALLLFQLGDRGGQVCHLVGEVQKLVFERRAGLRPSHSRKSQRVGV